MEIPLYLKIAAESGLSVEASKICIVEANHFYFDAPFSRDLQECITNMQVAMGIVLPLPN